LDKFNHSYFIQENFSRSYQNIWINAIKLFCKKHLDIEVDVDKLERPRPSNHLPDVLSQEEVTRFLTSFKNLKHRAIMMTYYACGLRKSELINLKIEHIDGNRNVIKIVNSKGAKDRNLPLPKTLKELLRTYYKAYLPKVYLFNGQKSLQYSSSSIDKLIKKGVKISGIKKKITAHSLRHTYATHLVEKNVNLRYIQEALGHKSSKTTEIYTKLSKEAISNMVSPIEFLNNDIIRNFDSKSSELTVKKSINEEL